MARLSAWHQPDMQLVLAMLNAHCVGQGEKTQRRRSTRTGTGKRTQSESAAPSAVEEPRRDRKRVRIGVVNGPSGQHVIAALRKLERLPGRPPPGTLLLAQDPRSLNRSANSSCIPICHSWA